MGKKFNTRIEDRHFQEMHHALGCPWPDEIMGETYRNYFCTGEDTETADRMRASPHWTNGRIAHGSTYFHVTDDGKAALREYIMANIYVPARFMLTFKHHEGSTVVAAKSRSAARYAAYRESEVDWPFMEYAAEIKSIWRHSPAINPQLSN